MKKALFIVAALSNACVLELHVTDIGAGQWDIWADNADKQEKLLAVRKKANQLCPDGYIIVNKDEDEELGTDKHHLVIKCSRADGARRAPGDI